MSLKLLHRTDNLDGFYSDLSEACNVYEKKRGKTPELEIFRTTLNDLTTVHFPEFGLPVVESDPSSSKSKAKGSRLSAQMKLFLTKGQLPIHSMPKVSLKSTESWTLLIFG